MKRAASLLAVTLPRTNRAACPQFKYGQVAPATGVAMTEMSWSEATAIIIQVK